MEMNKGPLIVISVVVLATAAAGVWYLGGPATSEQEKRDKARMSDVTNLSDHVVCLANAMDRILPERLPSADATIKDCSPSPRLTDPFNDKPYTYEAVSNDAYRICADFEHPELIAFPQQMDVDAGCMNYQFKR